MQDALDKSANKMKLFSCNEKWPVCLFDFTIKSRCPNYFIFRVQEPLTSFIREDYVKTAKTGIYVPKEADHRSLLIERTSHVCSIEHFEQNFRIKFQLNDPGLILTPLIDSLFESEVQQERIKAQFVSYVTKALTKTETQQLHEVEEIPVDEPEQSEEMSELQSAVCLSITSKFQSDLLQSSPNMNPFTLMLEQQLQNYEDSHCEEFKLETDSSESY